MKVSVKVVDGRLVYEPKNGEKEVTEAAMPTHVEAIQICGGKGTI